MRVENVPLIDPAKKALITGLEKEAASKVAMLVLVLVLWFVDLLKYSLGTRNVNITEAPVCVTRLDNTSRSLAMVYH